MRRSNKLNEAHPENDRVKERNRIAVRCAKRLNLPINDLYSVVENKPEFYSNDGIHFNESGRTALGRQVAKAVLGLC